MRFKSLQRARNELDEAQFHLAAMNRTQDTSEIAHHWRMLLGCLKRAWNMLRSLADKEVKKQLATVNKHWATIKKDELLAYMREARDAYEHDGTADTDYVFLGGITFTPLEEMQVGKVRAELDDKGNVTGIKMYSPSGQELTNYDGKLLLGRYVMPARVYSDKLKKMIEPPRKHLDKDLELPSVSQLARMGIDFYETAYSEIANEVKYL